MKLIDVLLDYELIGNFDVKLLRKYFVLPITYDGIYFKCFVCESSNLMALEINNSLLQKAFLPKEEILFFLSDFSFRLQLFSRINTLLTSKEYEDLLEEVFTSIIQKAVDHRCSDIHYESQEKSMIIRFRIDGSLKIFYVLPKPFFPILSAYIKMISKLDITQNRVCMDARCGIVLKKVALDCRVSTMPTLLGESIVLRLLDNHLFKKDFIKLGYSKKIDNVFDEIITLKQGLVLVSGPTGSGKSTTLYALLNRLNTQDRKIITVEDPIEYKLEQIQQVSVRNELHLGFDTILRSVLRQDPDIILIGEIRDEVSLQIALQASLTGHLVLASIHANDTLQTLTRLFDLDAKNYLVATSLKYIIAQRLVLSICPSCKKKGCEECNFRGFSGRRAMVEVLKMDRNIAKFLYEDKSIHPIKEYLKTIHFETLLEDGKRLVEEEITTLDEVYKVV